MKLKYAYLDYVVFWCSRKLCNRNMCLDNIRSEMNVETYEQTHRLETNADDLLPEAKVFHLGYMPLSKKEKCMM
jgi:hypothetical protein